MNSGIASTTNSTDALPLSFFIANPLSDSRFLVVA